MLQTQLVTQMFTSTDPAVLHSIFNICPLLCKSRPQLAALLVPSMAAWTPTALDAVSLPAMQIRAIEKTLRIVMCHLVKFSSLVSYHAQLNEAILRQRQRIEAAFASEQEARRARAHRKIEPVKHLLEPETSAQALKRARIEAPTTVDVSTLPVDMVVEQVMSGLAAISPDRLQLTFDVSVRRVPRLILERPESNRRETARCGTSSCCSTRSVVRSGGQGRGIESTGHGHGR